VEKYFDLIPGLLEDARILVETRGDSQ
jgi:hypothetical protein